ncbi:MAG: 2-C-methyl-D-erythritol 2,4-cyclodiphosphate synthase [Actinomycetota bacterium]
MIRVGLGFDVHPFDETRPLMLGGIEVPGSPGLAGHSDGDVLSHAVADALLGAAGLGDLGERFPSTAEWQDAASAGILAEVARTLLDGGWSIADVDATVVAQGPRIAPHRDRMIEAVAAALAISAERMSVKATTTDGLGVIGRGEGIAAFAVALIERN